MHIGKVIREHRKKIGMSQEELAKEVGVSRSAVAKWENNYGTPDIANIKIIALLFELSIDELLADEGEHSEPTENFYTQYLNKKCWIDLTGLNDGVDNVTLINQDETSLFYLSSKGKKGTVSKKYLTEIKVLDEDGPEVAKQAISYFDFIDKVVNIHLFEKNFLEAFFGEEKKIFEVTVTAVSSYSIRIEPGSREIPFDSITKLEVV